MMRNGLYHSTEEVVIDCDFCRKILGYFVFHWNKTKKEHTCPECKKSPDVVDPFLCKNCFKIDNSNEFYPCEFLFQHTKYMKFDQALGIRCDDCTNYLGSFLVEHLPNDDYLICKTCKKDFLASKTHSVRIYCSKCRIRKR